MQPAQDTQALEDHEVLSNELISSVLEAVSGGDAERLTTLLEPMHAADVADLLEGFS